MPFVPGNPLQKERRCREILDIQAAGLSKRLAHTGLRKAVVGLSGGLDSTLALLVTERAFGLLNLPKENIVCVTMPGFGTSARTKKNARALAAALGAGLREIDITAACTRHLKDLGHDPALRDITYENAQARERTQILMDLANREAALLVGTGDLSELALGWCTYNGDHMSMYGVNSGVPKTLVRHLVGFAAGQRGGALQPVLQDILNTPVSPELLPPDARDEIAQKTEELLGDYEVHDFYLYHFLRFGTERDKLLFMAERAFAGRYAPARLAEWLEIFFQRFYSQQFKRSCLPDGPKVGPVCLSPRGDWRMPSDAESGFEGE
jgi:NAD+ synthase (glutamine-hydrolysing)